MKKIIYYFIFLSLIFSINAQQLDVPQSLFRTNDGISNTKPSVSQIYDNLIELELKGLTNGFYTIEIRTNNEILRQKFIKL
jgi:hypothetical protein